MATTQFDWKKRMTGSYAIRRVRERHPYFSADYISYWLQYSTYVSFERKYLYYQVSKAACTSIKRLIHALERLPPIPPYIGVLHEVRRDMFIHERSAFQLKSLLDFDDQTQEYILTSSDFLRFTVVRNPYTRLQSAWKDKVLPCAPGYEYFYHNIKGRLPEASDPRSFITFPQFVAAIAQHDLRVCDHHWRLQVEHLFHNSMNFNHIGRTEALFESVNLFIKRAGFEPTEIPPAANASIPDVPYDQALADQVYDLYKSDFIGLRYARDSWKYIAVAKPRHDTVETTKFLDEITERNIVMGYLYDERTSLRERVRQLETAIKPDEIVAINGRGMELQKLSRFEEALVQYDKALVLKPDDITSLNNRGSVLIDLARFAEALSCYDKLLSVRPNDFNALNMRGLALEQLQRLEEALASYDKAISVSPSAVEAHYNRGNALTDLARFEDALASYDKALEVNPGSVVILNNRGLVLEELKRFDEALASYEKALQIKPDYVTAADNRRLLLNGLGQSPTAAAAR
jgi:tetratricopeptide (TPR) repeat protein